MKYYHSVKNSTGNIRPVELIDITSNIDYDCIIYFEDLHCQPNECEIYLDEIDNGWKVKLK